MSPTILFIGILWCAFVRILNWLSLEFLQSVLWLGKGRHGPEPEAEHRVGFCYVEFSSEVYSWRLVFCMVGLFTSSWVIKSCVTLFLMIELSMWTPLKRSVWLAEKFWCVMCVTDWELCVVSWQGHFSNCGLWPPLWIRGSYKCSNILSVNVINDRRYNLERHFFIT